LGLKQLTSLIFPPGFLGKKLSNDRSKGFPFEQQPVSPISALLTADNSSRLAIKRKKSKRERFLLLLIVTFNRTEFDLGTEST
jgi:hypothetical protein